jgi:magnesium transporter
MIVDCAIYRDGVRQPVPRSLSESLSDSLTHARETPDGFVWIGLHEPSVGEFDQVSTEFGLHPLAVEDAVHAHQRPKMERYGESLFVVVKTVRYLDETSDIELGEIMVFVGEGFVLTVRHGEGNPLTRVRRRIDREPDLVRTGPGSVLYGVLDEVVDSYEAIGRELESDILLLERRVFSADRTNDAGAIYSLKREVIEFRGAVQPLAPVARDLAAGAVAVVGGALRPYFRDVSDHVQRVAAEVESFNELLTSALHANLADVSVRMNEDMRKITAVAALVAVPTMIAGIYGMNFAFMPELGWRFGYPVVLGVMAGICLLLYRIFRKSGWL